MTKAAVQRCAAAALALLLSGFTALPAAALELAVFDLELHDTSLEGELRGPDPAEAARLRDLSALLRQTLDARPEVVLVDTKPLRERLAAMPALHSCNGCESGLAAELGAQRAVSGFVYKVSTLILYITVTVRDSADGRVLEQGSVSIRGNSDESWRRGLQYLLEHQILTASRN